VEPEEIVVGQARRSWPELERIYNGEFEEFANQLRDILAEAGHDFSMMFIIVTLCVEFGNDPWS